MRHFENINDVSQEIIGICIKIHQNLGAGLLESTYQQCFAYELQKRNIVFEKEKLLPIKYEDIHVENAYRVDFIVDNCIIVEFKSVEKFHPFHQAQILTYLKLSKMPLGLLINFNVKLLKDGVKRYVNNPQ